MWRLATNKAHFRALTISGLGIVLLTSTALVCAQDQSAGERYAKILSDTESLTRYNQQLGKQLESQQAQVARIEQQFTDIDATGAAISPLIQKMFESLETFLAADLPFLDPTQAGPDSRQERMVRLRDLMAQNSAPSAGEGNATDADAEDAPQEQAPDANSEGATPVSEEDAAAASAESAANASKAHALNAELYRRLLEAYQIELEYGRTMVSYKGKLEDGREADFVRVGRVSLLYRTADGEESGYWDAQQKIWVVADEYNKAIEKAVLISTKELAPDLITVPVPAPQEAPL